MEDRTTPAAGHDGNGAAMSMTPDGQVTNIKPAAQTQRSSKRFVGGLVAEAKEHFAGTFLGLAVLTSIMMSACATEVPVGTGVGDGTQSAALPITEPSHSPEPVDLSVVAKGISTATVEPTSTSESEPTEIVREAEQSKVPAVEIPTDQPESGNEEKRTETPDATETFVAEAGGEPEGQSGRDSAAAGTLEPDIINEGQVEDVTEMYDETNAITISIDLSGTGLRVKDEDKLKELLIPVLPQGSRLDLKVFIYPGGVHALNGDVGRGAIGNAVQKMGGCQENAKRITDYGTDAIVIGLCREEGGKNTRVAIVLWEGLQEKKGKVQEFGGGFGLISVTLLLNELNNGGVMLRERNEVSLGSAVMAGGDYVYYDRELYNRILGQVYELGPNGKPTGVTTILYEE